jgi:hypothetical protein
VRSFRSSSRSENEDGPWRGKWRYVERRIRHWKLPELLALGNDVTAVYEDNVPSQLAAAAADAGRLPALARA